MKKLIFLITLAVLGFNAHAEQVDVTNRIAALHCWRDKYGQLEDTYTLTVINGQLGMLLEYDEAWLKNQFYPVSSIVLETNTNDIILKTVAGGYFYFNQQTRKGGYFASFDAQRGIPLANCTVQAK